MHLTFFCRVFFMLPTLVWRLPEHLYQDHCRPQLAIQPAPESHGGQVFLRCWYPEAKQFRHHVSAPVAVLIGIAQKPAETFRLGILRLAESSLLLCMRMPPTAGSLEWLQVTPHGRKTGTQISYVGSGLKKYLTRKTSSEQGPERPLDLLLSCHISSRMAW